MIKRSHLKHINQLLSKLSKSTSPQDIELLRNEFERLERLLGRNDGGVSYLNMQGKEVSSGMMRSKYMGNSNSIKVRTAIREMTRLFFRLYPRQKKIIIYDKTKMAEKLKETPQNLKRAKLGLYRMISKYISYLEGKCHKAYIDPNNRDIKSVLFRRWDEISDLKKGESLVYRAKSIARSLAAFKAVLQISLQDLDRKVKTKKGMVPYGAILFGKQYLDKSSGQQMMIKKLMELDELIASKEPISRNAKPFKEGIAKAVAKQMEQKIIQ